MGSICNTRGEKQYDEFAPRDSESMRFVHGSSQDDHYHGELSHSDFLQSEFFEGSELSGEFAQQEGRKQTTRFSRSPSRTPPTTIVIDTSAHRKSVSRRTTRKKKKKRKKRKNSFTTDEHPPCDSRGSIDESLVKEESNYSKKESVKKTKRKKKKKKKKKERNVEGKEGSKTTVPRSSEASSSNTGSGKLRVGSGAVTLGLETRESSIQDTNDSTPTFKSQLSLAATPSLVSYHPTMTRLHSDGKVHVARQGGVTRRAVARQGTVIRQGVLERQGPISRQYSTTSQASFSNSTDIKDKEKPPQEWSSKTVSKWITSFGKSYEDYGNFFRDSGVDGKLLLRLEHNDFLDLEITNNLHIKKIMIEIEALKQKHSKTVKISKTKIKKKMKQSKFKSNVRGKSTPSNSNVQSDRRLHSKSETQNWNGAKLYE